MKIYLSILLILLCKVAFPVVKQEPAPPATYQKIDAMLKLAMALRLKAPDSARKVAGKALVISKSIAYKHGIGESFYVIGIAYWAQSFFPISQFYLKLSLPYLDRDNAALVNCYKNIGRNYIDLKEDRQALFYFGKGLRLAKHNTASKAELYTELTALYYVNGNYLACLKYIDTALKYSNAVANKQLQGILYNRRGQIYLNQHKTSLAGQSLDSSYLYSLISGNKRLQLISVIDKARLNLSTNKLSDAIAYGNKAALLADTLNAPELKQRALSVLISIYSNQGNLAKVNEIQNQALKLYAGIGQLNNAKTLQLIQDYFVLNDKLNQIELINQNSLANETMIKTQHKTIAWLIVSLITAVTFLVIIFIYYKQKNQMNNRLQLQHKVLLDQKKVIELQRTDLEGVNKLKDKLLAIIGHDLRTPIASISNIADLFTIDYLDAAEVQKLMFDLTPVIKGAELTLTNLTEFANSQMKGQSVAASNLNMFVIAEEMEETFRHQLQLKNITFHNNFLSSQSVWADVNQVKVVLRNLISNAIKFTNSHGYIRVFSSVRNNQMLLCVEDTGQGMTIEETNRLFDDNQHFTKRGTLGETGTGLGLLLCKELIELNNGKLWVETIEGKGCNFYFTLPLYHYVPEVQV